MPELVTIYRLEHSETGRGPFSPHYHGFDMYKHVPTDHMNQFPTPWQDGIDFGEEDYCGCLSIEELKEWFLDGMEIAISRGFDLIKVVVPERYVKFGEYQVMFDINEVIEKEIIIKGRW